MLHFQCNRQRNISKMVSAPKKYSLVPKPFIKLHTCYSYTNLDQIFDQGLRHMLQKAPPHCCPSSEDEIRQFMWLNDETEPATATTS